MQFKCQNSPISSNSVDQKFIFSFIWPIDRSLSGTTNPGQSGPGSDGNEGVPRILHGSSITEASASDCLVSYPGHFLWRSYPSTEMQSVYSNAQADMATTWLMDWFWWHVKLSRVVLCLKVREMHFFFIWTHSYQIRIFFKQSYIWLFVIC